MSDDENKQDVNVNNEEQKNAPVVTVDESQAKKQAPSIVLELFKLPLNVGFTVLNSLVEGFIVSKMWQWFVLSKFPHAPVLTYVNTVGLSLMVNFVLNEIHLQVSLSNARFLPIETSQASFQLSKNLMKIFVYHPIALSWAYLWWRYVVLTHM